MADVNYIEPITWQVVEKIIAKESPTRSCRPWAARRAQLRARPAPPRRAEQYGGADRRLAGGHRQGRGPPEVQGRDDPDRLARRARASPIDDEGLAVQKRVSASRDRPSFTLGGTGGGIAYNEGGVRGRSASAASSLADQRAADRGALIGWKEFEMEVVRDKADNCIIVCSIENLDPMGIHTGDSITVAPARR
jgi:carbamoyl-phosphate synthase large subunit